MSKMKRMVGVALLAGIIVLLNGTPGAAQLKLGYINSGRIMAEYKGFQDVTKRIQDLAGTYEKELQSMRRQLEESFKEFENQQLLLSDERKQEKQREMQESQQKIMAFQEEKFGNQGEILQKRQEWSNPIIERMQDILNEIGAKDNYDFIFDTINGNIVFAKEDKYDLTDRLLEEMVKQGPGSKK